jgi:uncharacterized metal-binding protein YceD (DUF177 family)
MRAPDPAWSMKVLAGELPEAGRHFELVADAPTRTALAEQMGLRALSRLRASFDVTRRGRDGLHVMGQVSATVGQNCVVTLDPLESEVAEEIDLVFMPQGEDDIAKAVHFGPESRDPPEPLENGLVDLGAIAIEFLTLGIDFYPRKPGVAFESPPADEPSAHPFAALSALKKGKSEGNR